MKFTKIIDFESLVENEKYVIDWEQLDDFPLFKDLVETMAYDGINSGRIEALKCYSTLLDDDSRCARDFLSESSLNAFYQRNKRDIELITDKIKHFNAYGADINNRVTYGFLEEARLIEKLFDANKLVFKKGWFREPENEVFYDKLVEKVGIGALEQISNELAGEIDNRGEVMKAFDTERDSNIFLSELSSPTEMFLLYRNYKQAVCENCMTDNDELLESVEIDNLEETISQIVVEAIVFAAYQAFDKEVAQQELEFYKVEAHTDEEQRNAEAHGEYDDIRDTDIDKPKTRRNR